MTMPEGVADRHIEVCPLGCEDVGRRPPISHRCGERMTSPIANPATVITLLSFGLVLDVVSTEAQTLAPEKIQRIEALLTHKMNADDIPALSIAIVVDGRLDWTEGFGLADMENSVSATAATASRTASVGKTITATAVMQLVERGRNRILVGRQWGQKAVPNFFDRLTAALADRCAIERGDDIETALGLGLAMPWAEGRGGERVASRFVGILYLGMSTGERR